jgi:hypothetical protein
LIENSLACISNVATTTRGGEVGFLLATTDRRENLRDLGRIWLFRLQDLFDLVVVPISYMR